MTKKTDITINQLIHEELTSALKKFPLFHSEHEAYAVLKEEIEEAEIELTAIKRWLEILWSYTKTNNNTTEYYETIKRCATNLIQETAQIAAMCDKHEKSKKSIIFFGRWR